MDDGVMSKKKGGLITKTWERCKSIGRGRKASCSNPVSERQRVRSRSWPRSKKKSVTVAPEGCFCVYVGPQMQRFVIKTEYANHPLFKMLLEEAESEYGYNSQGPLALPCHVDIFYKVLMEMDCETTRRGCTCVSPSPSAYHLLRSSSMHALNPF